MGSTGGRTALEQVHVRCDFSKAVRSSNIVNSSCHARPSLFCFMLS
jgi:hypothetical protein